MMEALGPGLWRVPTARGDRENAFLSEGGDGLTLVDVGWRSAPGRIVQALGERRWKAQDITRILVTHAHPDHVRGLAEMRALTGASVHIHSADAPWLAQGQVSGEGRSGHAGKWADALPLLHWQPVVADDHLEDGSEIEGIRAIHTPGHSPGHLAFHHLASNCVLVGDALFHTGRRRPRTGPDSFAADPVQRDRTLRLLPLGVKAVGFSHGAPLLGDEVETYREVIDALPESSPIGRDRRDDRHR